ncbi:MAG: PTS fructose transporter subunit EIIBC, partial [Halomonas sp.]|nr:PTS fructose transporter subunit EIIBC [Halomonas sp.]
MNIILITACPSGMATTFLAAKRLEQAAQRQGWSAHVEMHGEVAPLQAATAEQVANADLIVVAADHVPAPERFAGKRLFQAPIASALPDPSAFLAQAKREAPIYSAPAASNASTAASSAGGKKIVAVTACPTGVAHTFMAAEALAEAGKAMGHAIRVETQ